MDADSPMTDSSHSPDSSLLSPPESQTEQTTTTTTSSRDMPVTTGPANANGKRPRKDISNGATEDEDGARAMRSVNGKQLAIQEHKKSGYKWERAEDEPGYAWLNKKAADECNRAWDQLIHRDLVIAGRFGDPLDLADQEAARQS
ncbi:hypothetical protein AMS68_006914 [Peltaster fructicola]|uniref:Uncharacterized protein n=1 Tax=Peltaster fructicola TaxID=286661 RepID=A0A6H0Y320_9PEZI|nr:hypothetical protein AMS68_006914 [Peltaster fructicola]